MIGIMNRVLIVASIVELATGVALLIVPSLVGRLLFGVPFDGIAIPVARMAGIALVAFAIACWPGSPRAGMLTYNAAVALYLGWLGASRGLDGLILWPAVALHLILTLTLTFSLVRGSTRRRRNSL